MTKQKTTNKTAEDNSIANVHFSKYFEERWKEGKRRPISIRQNDKLYEDFKQVAQRLYGSVCRAIESFEAAVIIAAEQKVHLSNTVGQPINIQNVLVTRNLRSRRKLEVFVEPIKSRLVKPDVDVCYFCHKPGVVAVFRYIKSGKLKKACKKHTGELSAHSKWEKVKDV
jgi:hypothetical protein